MHARLSALRRLSSYTRFGRMLGSLFVCFLAAMPGWAANTHPLGASTVRSEQVTAELLLHAPQGIMTGAPVWAALKLTHARDWHTYWKNPGDSGLPTTLNWALPSNVHAGEVSWPTPKKFPLGPLANYGYDGTVMLVVPLHIGQDFTANQFHLGLNASWLACRTECIPEEGHFNLRYPINQPQTVHGRAFEEAAQLLPTSGQHTALRIRVEGQFLDISWPDAPGNWRGQALDFFPESPGLIDPGASWSQSWQAGTWSARVPLSPMRTEAPTQINVVVAKGKVPHGQPAPQGMAFEAMIDGTWPSPLAAPPAGISDALQAALNTNAALQPSSGESLGLWSALMGALVGGLILNLMPCIFPILSIKVLAFTQHANDRKGHRKAGFAYTFGVVSSFALLGAILLSLRAAGEQLGWGFQLQSPVLVASLATLFTLIALNLLGVFEVSSFLPSSVTSLQAKHPTIDAFLTGILTTAIASPCTAPFMGASLGLAISLPTGQALAVFAMLGLGMALPYLVASWIPALAYALPKPGAWMNTFKQLMAFPMWATVVWLLWILGQQTGVNGMATLMLALTLLSCLAWAFGIPSKPSRHIFSTLAAATLIWLLWAQGSNIVQEPHEPAISSKSGSANNLLWQPWTQELQNELLAQGRSVFVDYTAAWCVTCQFNKQSALADREVIDHMKTANIAMLRADWTRRDSTVTQALSALGRNGVPTYAFYTPGQPPVLLPEILRPDDLKFLANQR